MSVSLGRARGLACENSFHYRWILTITFPSPSWFLDADGLHIVSLEVADVFHQVNKTSSSQASKQCLLLRLNSQLVCQGIEEFSLLYHMD